MKDFNVEEIARQLSERDDASSEGREEFDSLTAPHVSDSELRSNSNVDRLQSEHKGNLADQNDANTLDCQSSVILSRDGQQSYGDWKLCEKPAGAVDEASDDNEDSSDHRGNELSLYLESSHDTLPPLNDYGV